MGDPFFFLFFLERRSVLFIWCDKIIKNVVFKSFCWLQLSIEGISFVPGPSTLLTWNWYACVCVCTLQAERLYSTARVLCVKLLQALFFGLAQHLKTYICTVCFHFGLNRADTLLAAAARHKATSGHWQHTFSAAGDLTKTRKLADHKPKVCVC